MLARVRTRCWDVWSKPPAWGWMEKTYVASILGRMGLFHAVSLGKKDESIFIGYR